MTENNCNCGKEMGEWVFSFALAAIFIWIYHVLYKPFEDGGIIFKFFGCISIIFLLFCIFIFGLTFCGTTPMHPALLIVPAGIYGLFAGLSTLNKGLR